MTQRRNRRAGVEDRWKKADGTPSAKAGVGSRWRARYVDESGQEHERLFARKADAQSWIDGQTASVVGGNHVAPRHAGMRFEDWAALWIAGYEVNRTSTVRMARSHIKRLNAEFGQMALRDIKPSTVKVWLAKLDKVEGLAPGTVRALYSRLRHILDDAVYDGYLGKNPCSKRISPPAAKQRVFCPSTEQVWQLYDLMPAHLRVSVLLGAFAGLRISEAVALRLDDVDFTRGVVHPHVQWGIDGVLPLKTEGSEAPVPVPRELTLLLSSSVQQWPGQTLVTNGAGGSIGPWLIDRAIREVRGQVDGAPDDFHFHDLRHYLASLLIASGADIKTVQARLRHNSAKTTLDVYGHLWPDADESTRSAISAVISERVDSVKPTAGYLRAD
ncbi:site-specific integrase [Williamsia sp. 1135]|uniref:tyrosine-type recombinase/integrase n=1 Tax=Williamsia sp. 1135 TaxID=1889262 RepID=UPI000A10E000|nr:site-specific integrase [Williamsia sp. 1135]ORM37963.1 site-specific integrase [Williamsia sp. 1135]